MVIIKCLLLLTTLLCLFLGAIQKDLLNNVEIPSAQDALSLSDFSNISTASYLEITLGHNDKYLAENVSIAEDLQNSHNSPANKTVALASQLNDSANDGALETTTTQDVSYDLIYEDSFSHLPYKENGNMYAVRKCCSNFEFFSFSEGACVQVQNITGFELAVNEIHADSINNVTIDLVTGLIPQCPVTGFPPNIKRNISRETHLLLPFGLMLQKQSTEILHMQDYCLEIAMRDTHEQELIIAYCEESSELHATEVIQKCCGTDEILKENTLECFTTEESEMYSLIYEHINTNPLIEFDIIHSHNFTCPKHSFPDYVQKNNFFLSNEGELCLNEAKECFPKFMFCIDGLTSKDIMAVVCRKGFRKCCPMNKHLGDHSCKYNNGYRHSHYMRQLLHSYFPLVGFQPELFVQSLHSNDPYLTWTVDSSGSLVVSSVKENFEFVTKNYCVDDSKDENENLIPEALLFGSETKEYLKSLTDYQKTLIGKCCPLGYNLARETEKPGQPEGQYTTECIPGVMSDMQYLTEVLPNFNETEMYFKGFPICEKGEAYHIYDFKNSFDDFVSLALDLKLKVFSYEGKCLESFKVLSEEGYCVDNYEAENVTRFSAVVCSPNFEIANHENKLYVISSLLIVSTVALAFTTYSLFSTRVRKGITTSRKINTLAGRILLCYVTSNLMGFFFLALNMLVNLYVTCKFVAGIIIFFLLSAFFWNTSICTESLLLTVRVRVSESTRFALHCILAWGSAAAITFATMYVDYQSHNLPCGTITPKIGRLKCFFSDRDALLLYFYTPIFLSLLANVTLLTSARFIRSSKLKRLELGPKRIRGRGNGIRHKRKGNENKQEEGSSEAHPNASGMRTHQNKNKGAKAFKLALWSGATWIFEVISFVLYEYFISSVHNWYDYLWYIPSCLNAIRGIGIFYILVLTEDKQKDLKKSLMMHFPFLQRLGGSRDCSTQRRERARKGSSQITTLSGCDIRKIRGFRNISVTTTLTQSSSIRSYMNDVGYPHAGSASQIRRFSQSSSSSLEECHSESGRPSFGTLPCVNEEATLEGQM